MQISIQAVLALCLASCQVLAADNPPKPPSAAEVALSMISERPRAYQNVCVAKDPSMRPGFEAAIMDLRTRIETLAKPLLASAQFSSLNQTLVPRELIDSVKEQNAALEKQLGGADAAHDCPKFLANIARIDGETLKGGIQQVLSGMQQMLAAMKAEAGK
jgi:hypothetical protein